MKEAQNIKMSPSSLGDIVSSIASRSGQTPYRNAKLTMMLKDSLGGDAKTLMFVCYSSGYIVFTQVVILVMDVAWALDLRKLFVVDVFLA